MNQNNYLVWQNEHVLMWLSAVGANAVRLQANQAGRLLDLPNALVDGKPKPAEIVIGEQIDFVVFGGETYAAILKAYAAATARSHPGLLERQRPSAPIIQP